MNAIRLLLNCATLPGILLAFHTQAADLVLFDFAKAFDPTKFAAQDAKVSRSESVGRSALRVVTGTRQSWPGVTLPAQDGRWDLSPYGYVALKLKNTGAARITVFCRVDNDGADGANKCVAGSLALNAGQTDILRVQLKRTAESRLGGKLFGLRGYPVASGGSNTVDASRVTQLLIFLQKPRAEQHFEIEDIRAGGTYTPPTAWVTDADPYFPCIDTFGQYKHKDWPGKTRSLADLAAKRQQEARELAAAPDRPEWDRYGGWARGPRLEATGFFRTQKHEGKWWLVDPEGHLFFSHGIDCVRMLDTSAVESREDWFADYPGALPEFREFLSRGYALKGHYAGRNPQCFSFAGANLLRKYGSEWRSAYADVIHQRLRNWGLNTIANWSDATVCLMRRTPYTDNLSSGGVRKIEGSEGYWGKFVDVFDPGFRAAARRSMESKRGKSAGDPWCIGYFSDNEMAWGDEVSLAIAALKSPPDQAAKKAFINDLKSQYESIEKLNAAWGVNHASWDALLQSQTAPDRQKARADLTAFYSKTADTYFRTIREAIREVAPRQLYLGCRFAWVNDLAARAAAPHCDVVSYNLYRRNIADFKYPGGDKPLIIGEFHFGALDRGLFHTGLVPVENQAARAQAYKDYVLGALKHPQFVGTHWFQWKDEPTTGRVLDEENYQIGFVDIADTPYPEMVQVSRQVAAAMYR